MTPMRPKSIPTSVAEHYSSSIRMDVELVSQDGDCSMSSISSRTRIRLLVRPRRVEFQICEFGQRVQTACAGPL